MALEEAKKNLEKKAAEIVEAVEETKEKTAEAIQEKVSEVSKKIEDNIENVSDVIEEKTSEVKKGFAKAGKKSKKHIEEVKAEAERLARKAERKAMELAGEKPKGAAPITRSKLERRGKKYQEAVKLIEKGKTYALKDAIELAIKTTPVKFDATLEIHARLGVDPRQSEEGVQLHSSG